MLMLLGVQDTAPTPTPAPSLQQELQRFHFGGYGEIHFNDESGSGSSKIDLARFVLYLGYDFADWIQLHSEVEIEHGFVNEDRGELSVEQLHVDFLYTPSFNMRIGRFLAPLGIVNQRHEPPSFNGVNRPDVETFIIPSTWSVDGLGCFGDLGEDWKYQVYLGSSLSGSGIDPVGGLEESRQEGQPGMSEPGLYGRMDWRPRSNLRTGLGAFEGGLDNGEQGVNPGNDARAAVVCADVEWSTGAFDWRALYALDWISDAQTIAPTIASRMDGWYVEGDWHVLPDSCKEGRLKDADALVFARYESLDTQAQMPGGAPADPAGEREILTLGCSFFPVSNLVLKLDYQIRDDHTSAGLPERFNMGIGWQF